ncbi:hypothetical protein [Tunicatimonas pelagia]|uniref:hypothetical protein n=1 Tax=Tunicatimonas pelagia TaxID=931531 RepID=UPI002665B0B6|nr:hypothetical protein [Tunicatimonas pelagia]WKN40952.1 hypothetical protein P0M28_18120 [Tunicatimonas pelagia]
MMNRLIACGLLVLLFGCQDDDLDSINVSDDPSITSLNGTWKVIAYEDLEQGKLITKTEENSWGMDVIVTFDDTTDPPNVSGRNTTNSIGGTFECTGQRLIQTSNIFSTYVGQPKWADKFGEVISKSELQFTINSSQLKLSNTTEQLNVVLEKE